MGVVIRILLLSVLLLFDSLCPSCVIAGSLGFNFDEVVNGLNNSFPTYSNDVLQNGENRWMGQTADNLAILEIINPENPSKATLILAIPSDAGHILIRNVAYANILINNIFPNWENRNNWLNNAITTSASFPDEVFKTEVEGVEISVKYLKLLSMLFISVEGKE